MQVEGRSWQGAPLVTLFPNRLRAEPPAAPMPPRWALVALLVVVCLVPRVWQATRWNILWGDSLLYLHAAEDLERGDRASAFEELNLNIYPLILWGLRRTGWDWTVTGEWWSVTMATLAVLPLFGWVRRQFDDTVAVVACLLYAFHPLLIAFTPLIIRDATFWFLFNLTVYLLWRAVIEIRWSLFLAAGVALTLTVHTRSEGWLLVVPLVVWPLVRLIALPDRRAKIALGGLGCAAVAPLLMAAVNLTWLRDCPRWDLLRPMHKQMAMTWLRSVWPDTARPAVLGRTPEAAARAPDSTEPIPSPTPSVAVASLEATPSESGLVLTRKLILRLVKGYSYVFGLLTVVGIGRAWRIYPRAEHQALLLMSILLLVIVWVRYTQANIDVRYFLPMVLVSFPWMALGLLWIGELIVWLSQPHCVWTSARRRGLVAALVVVAGLLGLPQLKLNVPVMHCQAALGQWLRTHLGPGQKISGSVRQLLLLEYYSRGRLLDCFDPTRYRDGRALPPMIEKGQADVVFFWLLKNRDACLAMAQAMRQNSRLPYCQIAQDRLPPQCGEAIVFLRRDRAEAIISR